MAMQPVDAAADREVLDAARVLLARMGVDPADLLAAAPERPALPTFSTYIPVVSAAVSPGTRGTYGSYWNRLEDRWGQRTLLEPTPSEILRFGEEIKANAVVRRNSRGGRNTMENFIAALRCLYRHAERDGLITTAENPALKVPKPRRLPSPRHALSDLQLEDINHIAGTTGDDPELDTMLLRLHTESAGRRGGALNQRPRDLDPDQCLLRYRHGEPVTYRRYDHLWDRLGRHLPWVATQNVSTHWVRHTTLTWVERNFGIAIAHAYAGHFDANDNATLTYVKATLADVATALAALTGEPHPLATS